MAQRSRDPTRTTSIQREYARKLRRNFSEINTQIREGVRDRDSLGFEQLAEPVPDFSFTSLARKEQLFRTWLDKQLDDGVMNVVRIDDNQYVQRAYDSGLKTANSSMREGGVDVGNADLASLRNQPIHQDKLELLFVRNFEALDGITSDVSKEMSRVLTDSLSEGVNPNVAAQRLTDRVDSIGKTRATTLARTEILKSHNEAALTRYEQILGDDAEVEIEAEILTAEDQRVCDVCEPKHGTTMSIKEARSSGPPYHPNCRCTVRSKVKK